MTQLTSIDAVPGIGVPGIFPPGGLGIPGAQVQSYLYAGHLVLYYLDYIDSQTEKTLQASPGNSYAMFPVSSRAGLGEPPPDGRWGTPSAPSYDEILTGRAAAASAMMAAARAHNASLQARMARGEKISPHEDVQERA